MYELADYLAMIEDDVRTPAYLAALRAVIRPGDRVLELGTGFGYFAVQAVRAGAEHVWAVEPSDAIAHGRAIAAANGCADRITFIQARADQVTLEPRADVLVEDLRGISPLHGARLDVLRDAHARLLVPGARVIPHRDALVIAPSELPSDLPRLSPSIPDQHHGISVAPVRALLSQTIHRTRGEVHSLLADGVTWATLEYAALAPGDPSGRAQWTVARDGVFAGFLSWFATTLAPGISFETGPATGRTVYDRGFLSTGAPIPVRAGDRITVDVRTRFDGTEHVWVWDTTVTTSTGTERRHASSLASRAMSALRRARRAADHVPERTTETERLAQLAVAIDGARTLGEIAAMLHASARTGFADEHAALRWAGDLLARVDEESRA
jgi:Ribosomal protein L11 methyltransferase (PrmA)